MMVSNVHLLYDVVKDIISNYLKKKNLFIYLFTLIFIYLFAWYDLEKKKNNKAYRLLN